MIYLLLSGASAYLGIAVGLGSTTLLRPLLDAVSPLSPASIALLCTMATLVASLVSAFFALARPLPLHQDELILLATGAALGGITGDLVSSRFLVMLPQTHAVMLQNALLFTLIALPSLYFSFLSPTLRPLSLTRMVSFPAAFIIGLLAAFLSFGAEPVTLCAYYLLFDAEDDEASVAALTVALCAMAGRLITMMLRQRFAFENADVLLWLIPGALLGALAAMVPALRTQQQKTGHALIRMSLFTSLLNIASAFAH